VRSFITDPQGIEDKSMQIIEEILGAKKQQFSPAELAIIKRVIHTTADFEYADLFSASPGAITAGLKAFKEGNQVIVADTNMIVSGVNKGLLSSYNSKVECLVAEGETRREALAAGVTRSMINIRRASEKYPGAIYAIGNAPTALYELLQLIEDGRVQPALVIGVPVGFVEAEESKEALLQSDVPHILIRGRKGGSTVAVAIINAMLKLAGKE